MMEDPAQQGGSKYGVPHHLSPVYDLLVGGKDNGRGFIGVADEGEEPVGLAAGDRSISDLVDDEELGFLQVPKAEARGAFCLCGIQDLHEVHHLLEADGITAVDGVEPQPHRHHGLP